MADLILGDEVYAVVGAAMEVYYKLGIGFLEPVYQAALAVEFNGRGIPYVKEPKVEVLYKDVPLNKTYRPDFICFDPIISEMKTQFRLTGGRGSTNYQLPQNNENAGRIVNELWGASKT